MSISSVPEHQQRRRDQVPGQRRLQEHRARADDERDERQEQQDAEWSSLQGRGRQIGGDCPSQLFFRGDHPRDDSTTP
jgi:hypothetical protein